MATRMEKALKILEGYLIEHKCPREYGMEDDHKFCLKDKAPDGCKKCWNKEDAPAGS